MRPSGADLRDLSFRRAEVRDVPALVELRLEFMRIVKDNGLGDEAGWRVELARRFTADLADQAFVAWLCLDEGRPVAASGIAFAADRRAGTADRRGETAGGRAGTADGRAGTAVL